MQFADRLNFGDSHLHNEDLISAVQSQASFEPGECVIAWVESDVSCSLCGSQRGHGALA